MAKIPGKRPSSSGSPRGPLLPGWLPLVVAVIGFAIVLSPEDTAWSVRALGASLLAAGSFWLGQDRQHDPHDRLRIVQLERALIAVGVLRREDVRADDGRPDGAQPGVPSSPATRPGPPPGFDRPPRGTIRPGAPAPIGLDDPLPGEPR